MKKDKTLLKLLGPSENNEAGNKGTAQKMCREKGIEYMNEVRQGNRRFRKRKSTGKYVEG